MAAIDLNIVLVHGAWGDAEHWRGVIPPLHERGYRVTAVENPLTSLADDVERTKQHVAAQRGPTLLVGHSYGGAVITNAGNDPNVVALVYIAAFAPDEGESLSQLLALREAPPGAAIIQPDKNGFLWLDQAKFRDNFCQDVDRTEALVMSVTQKPIAARCFDDKTGSPAWKSKPCYYQVSANDRMIPPETEQYFADRMKAKKTITLQASHASMASRPSDVCAFIEEAARAVPAMART